MSEIVYAHGTLPAKEVQDLFAQFLREASNDPDAVDDAAHAGVSLETVSELNSASVRVREAEGGMTGFGEALIIALIVKGVELLIDEVFVPWVRRRKGPNAIGERRSPE